MKKIVLFSFFILAIASMTSCTADNLPETKEANLADGIGGGNNGQLPPPPPPK